MSGMFKISAGTFPDYSDYSQSNEPNPEDFEILWTKWSYDESYALMKVRYPNCTTFEGHKLIVFRGISKVTLAFGMKTLDPHFYQDNDIIARFRPDEEGEDLARELFNIRD